MDEPGGAMTGCDVSLLELIKAGERADSMSRIFNVREGFTPADHTLPSRRFEPMEGPLNGERIDPGEFEQALSTTYTLAGWDLQTGMPTEARLMDLEWAAGAGARAWHTTIHPNHCKSGGTVCCAPACPATTRQSFLAGA